METLTVHLDAETVAALKKMQETIKAEMAYSGDFFGPSLPQLARHCIRKWCGHISNHEAPVHQVVKE